MSNKKNTEPQLTTGSITRPRLGDGENKRISMFFTEEQLNDLKEAAAELQISYSSLVRSLVRAFLNMKPQEIEAVKKEISDGIFGSPVSKWALTVKPVKKTKKVAA